MFEISALDVVDDDNGSRRQRRRRCSQTVRDDQPCGSTEVASERPLRVVVVAAAAVVVIGRWRVVSASGVYLNGRPDRSFIAIAAAAKRSVLSPFPDVVTQNSRSPSVYHRPQTPIGDDEH